MADSGSFNKAWRVLNIIHACLRPLGFVPYIKNTIIYNAEVKTKDLINTIASLELSCVLVEPMYGKRA